MMREDFASAGFAVAPLFDPEIVRAAQQDISELVDRLSAAFYFPYEQSYPGVPVQRRLDCIWEADRSQANILRMAICNDAHRGKRLQELAHAPELKAMAKVIGGRALSGQVVRARAGIASFPEHLHDWHSDVAIDDGSPCGRVWITAWIPLSDAGPETGGLELVPGRRTTPLPHRSDRAFTIDEAVLGDFPREEPICPAGSVLFLDRFTPHRSLPISGDARFALVIWMKAA